MLKVPLLTVVLFVFACAAHAQSTWVTISGQVLDPTNAAIPDAVIRVDGPDPSTSHEVKTDVAGAYTVPFLAPGTYQIRASAAGFREILQKNVTAAPGDAIQLSFTLEIGELSGHVSVSDIFDYFQIAETASRHTTMDAVQVKSFPTLGRQVFNIISLAPGVLFTQQEFGPGGYSGLRNWDLDGKYIINGGLEGTNQFLLNNFPISLTGRWQLSPSVDAVQDVRVLTNTYDAQFGRTGGGTVITTLKSGGNRWHGETYEFLHNGVTDANTFDNNLIGRARGKHIAHQYGGTLSGPLRTDKDFIFLSLDNYWEEAPSPLVSDTVPSLLRDGQHFSDYGFRIYDPYSARKCVLANCYSPYIRDPFPGNVIPDSLISPIGRKIMALYPAPNGPGLSQNYNASGNLGKYLYFQPIARWDHNWSDRDRLYALFAFDHENQKQSENGFPSPADFGDGNVQRTSQHYVLDWTRVSSPSSVWDARLSFGRFTELFPDSACPSCLTSADLGMNLPRPPGTQTNSAPHIVLDPYSPIIGNTYSWGTENQIDFSPNLMLNRGRQVLHFGAEITGAAIGQGNPGRANGSFLFDHYWTAQYDSRYKGFYDGTGIADLLLGLPSRGYIDYNDSSYRRWPYLAGYAQDTIKLAPRFSVSLGLRYDVQVPFSELHGRLNAGFDPAATNPQNASILARWNQQLADWNRANPSIPYPAPPSKFVGGLQFASGSDSRAFHTDWADIQPRIGIAWSPAEKTVIRAGAGIFYRTATQFGQSYGYNQPTYYQRTLDGFTPSAHGNQPYSLADPFPNGLVSPKGASLGLTANLGNPVDFDGRNRPIPRTYQYSFGLQRELPGLILLEADYSGSRTVHDAMPVELSAGLDDYRIKNPADENYLNTLVPNPFIGSVPSYTPLGGAHQVPIAFLMQPYPQFDGVTQTNLPVARYRYDSLQLKLEKRVIDVAPAGILSFLFSYTFSKSFAMDHLLNPSDPSAKPVRELSAEDRPQSVGFAGTWDLPLGWGRRFFSDANPFLGALINSWSVDWIYTFASGVPVDAPDGTFVCGSYRAPGGQTRQHWFNNNPDCWIPRASWEYRTTPDRLPNIRTPAAGQLNLSVEKTIWFSDRHTLQLRGEAYNLTNTPVFPAPSTDLGDSRFGELPLRQANFARYIQLALRFSF